MDNSENLYQLLNEQVNVSRETAKRLGLFAEFLKDKNQQINLISKNTVKDIYQRHILDSLQLVKYIDLDKKILDIGTGAGFPGIVLTIAGAQNITLVESIRKKCNFLIEVKEGLKLNSIITNERIENIANLKSDIITARAVAPLTKLLALIYNQLKKDTECFFFKGKNYQEEILEAKKIWQFNYKSYKSLTSKEGVILKISNIWK